MFIRIEKKRFFSSSEGLNGSHSIEQSTTRSAASRADGAHVERSSASDWSVPPTLELSPTSITSSSPDLSQNQSFHLDSLVELDSTVNAEQSHSIVSSRHRSSSSSVFSLVTMCYAESNDYLSKSDHWKPAARSSMSKPSSSPRLQRRRRDPDTNAAQQTNGKIPKRMAKMIRFESDDHSIIADLLNDMIK